MQQAQTDSSFYIIAHEPGAENPAIPTWACRQNNPAKLHDELTQPTERVDITEVPGAFQLLNVLTEDECLRLINISELQGYQADAAVSLPRSVRHNDSFTWVADKSTNDIIWQRCGRLINRNSQLFDNKKALGLNARFRFYRYSENDYFSPHTDGSWPGTEIIAGELVTNAYDDRWSQLTLLLFLSDDYAGGRTQFHIENNTVPIKTPIGGVLCFPHGMHPLHCLHSSETVTSGIKYIIRSDVLFEL